MNEYEKTTQFSTDIEMKLVERTGLPFRCIPFIEGRTVGFVVFYKTTVVCQVSFLAHKGIEQFYPMTEAEVNDAINAFLGEDGVAA